MTTVAPKERINITYKPATGQGNASVELPLKMLVVGDFSGRPDARPVEDRQPINVSPDTFADVLKEQKLELDVQVPNKLSDEGGELNAHLRFQNLSDFTPEGVVMQIPELRQLLELRNALRALKGPMGNYPEFRKRIEALLSDEKARDALMKELGL